MKTVRLIHRTGPFIRGQKVQVVREASEGLYLKGKDLTDPMKWRSEVLYGPVPASQTEEAGEPVPEERPLKQKVRELWKNMASWGSE